MDGLDSPLRTLVCFSLLNGPTKDRENFREFTCSPAKTNIKLLSAWLTIYYVSYIPKKYSVGLYEKKLKQLFNQFSPSMVDIRVCSSLWDQWHKRTTPQILYLLSFQNYMFKSHFSFYSIQSCINLIL